MNSKYRFGEPNIVMESEKTTNLKHWSIISTEKKRLFKHSFVELLLSINFHLQLQNMLLRCRSYRCFFFGWWPTNNQLISICFFLLKLINSKIKISTNSFCILWAHSVNVESFRNSITKLLHPYIRREQQILIVS